MIDSRIIDDRAQALAAEYASVGVTEVRDEYAILTAYDNDRKMRVELWDVATERCVRVDVVGNGARGGYSS